MGLFGTHRANKGTVDQVVEMIEKYYKRRGLDLDAHQVDTCEGYGWWLEQGSARVYVFVQDDQLGPMLRVNSPILHFPDANRELFYLRLLEKNRDLSCCWISACDEVVIVTSQRPTLGLDQEELDAMIWNVSQVADLIDNELAQEFAARLFKT